MASGGSPIDVFPALAGLIIQLVDAGVGPYVLTVEILITGSLADDDAAGHGY